MAKRPTTPGDIPDALREAVERTVEATRGSAQETRDRAQGVLDELVETLERSRSAVLGAIDDRRPATQDDVKEAEGGAAQDRPPARRDRGAAAEEATLGQEVGTGWPDGGS